MGSVKNGKQLQRATLEQLIAHSEKQDRDKMRVEEIEIPSMEKTLLFKRPSDELILDMINDLTDNEDTKAYYDELAKVLYECCDDLKSPELYDALDVGDPVDVVYKIMDLNDIVVVGEAVCGMNPLFKDAEGQVKNV